MSKKIIWAVIIIVVLLVIWWLVKGPATAPTSESDTVSGINQDLQGINPAGIDSEFQSIDKDLNSL